MAADAVDTFVEGAGVGDAGLAAWESGTVTQPSVKSNKTAPRLREKKDEAVGRIMFCISEESRPRFCRSVQAKGH